MDKPRDSWRDTLRAVGESLVDVLRAEVAVVGETWRRSGRELGKILTLALALAYLVLICLPSLLIIALLMGLSEGLGWPLWAATLTVAAVVAVVALVLLQIVKQRIRHRLESPVATVRQRFTDHRAWWDESILSGGTGLSEPKADRDAVAQQDAVAQGDRDEPQDPGD